MFDNIGRKIKIIAHICFWLGAILSLAVAVYCLEEYVLLGALIAVLGPILSWVGNFILYGFGQLIENSDKLVEIYEPQFESQEFVNVKMEDIHLDQKWICEKCGSAITSSLDYCPICEMMNKPKE